MRHRVSRHHLGRPSKHREATLRNLAQALFKYERIRTTLAKAKALRPFVEPLITKARKDDLHSRRLILRELSDKDVVKKLFDSIAPRFTERPGGYTRIIKSVPRPGDGAEMAYIELVVREVPAAEEKPAAEAATEKKKPGLLSRVFGGGRSKKQ